MIITDCHVHSRFSSDSQADVKKLMEEAMKRRFPYFYLTDHMDYDFPENEEGLSFLFDPEEYFSFLKECQMKCGPLLTIRRGIEVGLKPQLHSKIASLLEAYPFDFVIGSVHLVEDVDPFLPSYWEGRSVKSAISSYYQATIENIRTFHGFDTLGHLDYVIRYAPSRPNLEIGVPLPKDFSYSPYADYIDTILNLLIDHGIALEINTAGFAKKLGHPNPCEEIIRRYRELGGERITIGSDAHKPEAYAYEFPLAEDLLRRVGFRYYTIYKERKAEMIPF